jgi:hypothetical protein
MRLWAVISAEEKTPEDQHSEDAIAFRYGLRVPVSKKIPVFPKLSGIVRLEKSKQKSF